MEEVGLPPGRLQLRHRQRRHGRRRAGAPPQDALRLVHRLARRSASASTSSPPRCSRARSGSSAWSPRWAARTRSSSTRRPISTPPRRASRPSAFGFQGQKCSACSRAIVSEKVYDAFLDEAQARRSRSSRSASPTSTASHMGPVVNAAARDKILDVHRDRARRKAGWSRAAAPVAGQRRLLRPAHRDRRRQARRDDRAGGDLRPGAGRDPGARLRRGARRSPTAPSTA